MAEIDSSTDSPGRSRSQVLAGPSHVGIDVTNRCNLRCLHCYNRSGQPELDRLELTDSELHELLDQVVSVRPRSVCWCGGEPLLRPDLVTEGTRLLVKNGINSSMVSNGLELTQSVAAELKRAGLGVVQFSLDGATAATHDLMRGRRGAFDQVLAAIDIARSVDLPVSIAFCPTASNIDQVASVVELAETMGAYEFRTQPLMLLGRAIANRDRLEPTPDQYRELVRTVKRLSVNSGINIVWTDPVDHLVRLAGNLQQPISFMDIKSDGAIVVSSYLPLIVGNVKRYSLNDYWQSGFPDLWSSALVSGMARMIRSTRDLYQPDSPLPIVYFERPLELDLIDDQLLTMSAADADRMLAEHCRQNRTTQGG